MTLASTLILLGIAFLTAAALLPIVYGVRQRIDPRPGPRGALRRAAAAQGERVSA